MVAMRDLRCSTPFAAVADGGSGLPLLYRYDGCVHRAYRLQVALRTVGQCGIP